MSVASLPNCRIVEILESYRDRSRTMGVPPPPVQRGRNLSVGSSAFVSYTAGVNTTDYVPAFNAMLSNSTAANGVKAPPPVISNSVVSGSREHRRLDRSVSEPSTAGDRLNNNHVPSQQQQQQQPQQQPPHSPAVNSSRYKTELCRPFEESGHCKYGDKCQFAHGMQELRTLARHPKYKTELCRTFHTVGFCPYGPRCHFIHNEDERKLNNLVNANQQANSVRPVTQLPQQQPLTHQHPQQLQKQQQYQAQWHLPPVERINFGSLSSLGSGNSDSNPSSLASGSPPSLSPTFTGGDDTLTSSGSSTCGRCASPTRAYSPVFNFNTDPVPSSSMISPLNVLTPEVSIETLIRTLESTRLNEELDTYFRLASLDGATLTGSRSSVSGYSPPTPESVSGDSVSSGGSNSPPLAPLVAPVGPKPTRLPCFDQFRSNC